MEEAKMPKADFVSAIVLILFGSAVVYLSAKMPTFREMGANPYSAPGIVPGFIGATIILMSIIMLVRSIIKRGHRLDITGSSIKEFFKSPSTKRIFITIALSLIYGVGLLGKIPYLLSTLLYVLVFVFVFEYRRGESFFRQYKTPMFAFVQAILTSGVIAAIFRYAFLVNLP